MNPARIESILQKVAGMREPVRDVPSRYPQIALNPQPAPAAPSRVVPRTAPESSFPPEIQTLSGVARAVYAPLEQIGGMVGNPDFAQGMLNQAYRGQPYRSQAATPVPSPAPAATPPVATPAASPAAAPAEQAAVAGTAPLRMARGQGYVWLAKELNKGRAKDQQIKWQDLRKAMGGQMLRAGDKFDYSGLRSLTPEHLKSDVVVHGYAGQDEKALKQDMQAGARMARLQQEKARQAKMLKEHAPPPEPVAAAPAKVETPPPVKTPPAEVKPPAEVPPEKNPVYRASDAEKYITQQRVNRERATAGMPPLGNTGSWQDSFMGMMGLSPAAPPPRAVRTP